MSIEQEFADKLVQYKHIIYKVCFMYADNKDDVNDLYQESVFNIWKSYQSFRGESSFTTWVYRISLNTCISDFRKKKKHDYVPLEQQVDIMEDCERNELLKEMYSLIKRLNKVDRMFILLWLDEKSYDEIAEITGTSRNNVAIKLHRIKEKLKNMIMDNLIEAIRQLKQKKNAVILGHYYQKGEIQDIADYVGDSLALAQWAARTEADIIVMCGVHFMGETAKVLCPDKKVLVPDMAAGCSLADSCPADKFSQFVKEHPGYTVISYVNTTAAVKAVTDVVVTSTNAKQIVESFPKDEKIIFGPDRNLGNYINSVTGRNMLLWNGACHVHEEFSVEKIVEIKQQHPDAVVLAHPECKSTVLKLADVVGSTAALLKYAVTHPEKSYIVATESGILHEMRKQCPQTTFIPAPPNDSTCACNECGYMRLNTLGKLYDCLKNESPEIKVDAEIAEKAVKPIKRMLEISAQLGL